MRGMDHAVNRAVVDHEMSTDGRGSILSTGRGSLIGEGSEFLGREARNSSQNPADFVPGVQGDIGVMDPDSHCDY